HDAVARHRRAARRAIDLEQRRLDRLDGAEGQVGQRPAPAAEHDGESLLAHAASPKLNWQTWPAALAKHWKSSSGMRKSSTLMPNDSFSATQLYSSTENCLPVPGSEAKRLAEKMIDGPISCEETAMFS